MRLSDARLAEIQAHVLAGEDLPHAAARELINELAICHAEQRENAFWRAAYERLRDSDRRAVGASR